MTDTIYYTRYDEYYSESEFTYAIAGNGTAKAIVAQAVRVPNC